MHVIMRFAKRKGGQIPSMESHNERKKEKYASNPDIDINRIKDNYHIIQPENTYHREINSRIKSAGCRTRKDSVKMVEVLFTASPEFFASTRIEEHREYFERAVKFIQDEVGKDNVFTATVHMDESTPHMHICFTPITADGRLSAKEIIGNQKKLSIWQDKAHQKFVERWDFFERGTSAMITKREHVPLWLFKQAQRLDRQQEEIMTAINDITSFNAPRKKAEAIKVLQKWFPQAQKFTAEINKNKKSMDSLKKEVDNLETTVDRQSKKIMELHVQNEFTLRTAKKQKKLLDAMPKEELQLREKDIEDIIKGMLER